MHTTQNIMKLSIAAFNYINYLKETFNYSKKELNSLRLPRPLFIWLVEIIYCKINLNRLLIMLLWCKVTFIFISAYWIVSLTQYCCLIKPNVFLLHSLRMLNRLFSLDTFCESFSMLAESILLCFKFFFFIKYEDIIYIGGHYRLQPIVYFNGL